MIINIESLIPADKLLNITNDVVLSDIKKCNKDIRLIEDEYK
jgi:hypothetical protein